MNACVTPSPYPMLFRKKRELYMLVFRPRQLWIGGGDGSYFFYLGGMVVWHKSDKIDGPSSSGLSRVVDLSTLQRQYFCLSFSPFWNTRCPLRFHYTKQCAPPVGSDFRTCAQRSFTRLHHLLSFLLLQPWRTGERQCVNNKLHSLRPSHGSQIWDSDCCIHCGRNWTGITRGDFYM